MTLAEALENVDLEPGQTYRCNARGHIVEVRVSSDADDEGTTATARKRLLTKNLCDEDIMLDAWCELPGPTPKFTVTARPGTRLMPDIPEIPRDEDDAS